VLPEICVDELGSSFTVRLSVAIKAAVAPPKTTRSLISLLAVWKGLVQMSFWSFAAPRHTDDRFRIAIPTRATLGQLVERLIRNSEFRPYAVDSRIGQQHFPSAYLACRH
jgi:hypothetical protein